MKNKLFIPLVLCLLCAAAFFASAQAPGSRLTDEAGVLSSAERSEIVSELDKISEKYSVDVVVVIVADLGGKTAEAFADDYFDYGGYGFGEFHDGILFCVDTGSRVCHISTEGSAVNIFTDLGQDYILEKVLPALKKDDYPEAIRTFAKYAEKSIKKVAEGGKPYDAGHMPLKPVSFTGTLMSVLGGYLCAVINAKNKEKGLKTAVMREDAGDYVVGDSVHIIEAEDKFISKSVTSVAVSKRSSSGSSRGGSSTHVSSSGRTHGGSSRHF